MNYDETYNRAFAAGEVLRHFTLDPTTGQMVSMGTVKALQDERSEDVARRVASSSEWASWYSKATHIVVLPDFNPEFWGPSVFKIERPVAANVVGGV